MSKSISKIFAIIGFLNFFTSIQASGFLKESAECAKIMGSCIAAATAYGISQDQITYRYCPEYFTQGFHKAMMQHWPQSSDLKYAKKLFDENPNNPTLRATIWGTVASWWMGAIIGVPVTLACRVGSWPQLTYKQIAKPLAYTMGLTAASTAFSGLQAAAQVANVDPKWSKYWLNAKGINIDGVTDFNRFFVNGNAHTAAYAMGPLWSIGLIGHILKTRYKLTKTN